MELSKWKSNLLYSKFLWPGKTWAHTTFRRVNFAIWAKTSARSKRRCVVAPFDAGNITRIFEPEEQSYLFVLKPTVVPGLICCIILFSAAYINFKSELWNRNEKEVPWVIRMWGVVKNRSPSLPRSRVIESRGKSRFGKLLFKIISIQMPDIIRLLQHAERTTRN